MPLYNKNIVNPNYLRLMDGSPVEKLGFMMNNLTDVYFDNITGIDDLGTFDGNVLSGLGLEDNTGGSLSELDGKVVNGYLYLAVQPKPKHRQSAGDIRFAKDRADAVDKALKYKILYYARSRYKINGSISIPFSQEVKCYYSQGSHKTNNYSDLIFDIPPVIQADPSFDIVKTLGFSVGAQSYFDNTIPFFLGDEQSTMSSGASLEQQIPNAILPLDPSVSRITSTMGKRIWPVDPSVVQSNHSGIDFGAPNGTPLFAMFDGIVVAHGKSGAPFISDPKYGMVGSKNYGLKIVTKHTAPMRNGEQFSFTAEYGHVQDYFFKTGDVVKAGQVIATVGTRGGSTGNHLHLTVRKGSTAHSGKKQDPLFLFDFHNKYPWKHESKKAQWYSQYPELATGS